MKISHIISTIERIAPRPLQESYDNAGVQVGSVADSLTSALICLDVTEDIVDEAIELGANLIISHHPLIFKGLKSLTGKDYIERCIIKAIRHNICIYSAHTNLDNAIGGVNFKIAEKLGISNLSILEPKSNSLLKLVTFVPTEHAGQVREAITGAGAGSIGNYDSCTYNTDGIGTFRANEGADPFCGKIGHLHKEPETRIEVILPSFLKSKVENALRKAHPYEEPAYDFYQLQNEWTYAGAGVVGTLPEPVDEMQYLKFLKQTFNCGSLKYAGLKGKPISRVAVCGGSASSLVYDAINADADIFITGEIKYHEFFGPDSRILMAELGHFESEQFTTELLAEIISNEHPEFNYQITTKTTNPIKYL